MTFIRFPEDELQRDAWIKAIRREQWMPDKDSRLCQSHFISGRPSCYPNNPYYAPTRFSYKSTSAVIEKVMLTDMRGCRPGEENNHNTTLNTRSKGRNVEENIAKMTQRHNKYQERYQA